MGRDRDENRGPRLRHTLLLIALVAAVVFGTSFQLVLTLLTIFSWPIFARQTRGLTLQLKTWTTSQVRA